MPNLMLCVIAYNNPTCFSSCWTLCSATQKLAELAVFPYCSMHGKQTTKLIVDINKTLRDFFFYRQSVICTETNRY